jgi:hypothetical protein
VLGRLPAWRGSPGEDAADVGRHLLADWYGRRVLGQRLGDHRVDVGCSARVHLAGRNRHLAYVLVRHADRGVAHERRPAEQQLVEQAAGRVQVAALVDPLAAGLLGDR